MKQQIRVTPPPQPPRPVPQPIDPGGQNYSAIITTAVLLPEIVVSGSFTLTGVAEIMGTAVLKVGVTVKADDDNAGDVYVGGTGVAVANGMRLGPGESVPIAVDNLSDIWVVGAALDIVHYVGG